MTSSLTAGVSRGRPKWSLIPALRTAAQHKANWRTPPASTAIAIARTVARAAVRSDQQRGDQGEVEQSRREGGDGEAGQRIEHAREQGDQADEDQIGEGVAGQLDRQLELARRRRIIRHEQPEEGRHRDLEEDGDDQQRRHEHRQDLVREALRVLMPARPRAAG